MTLLRLAAAIAAITTITLNAKHGFEASKVFELAVLFAILNAALDTAKCTLIGATVLLWRRRAYLLAILSLLLFPLLFLNSVWNAVSQVVATREDGKARAVADHGTRRRAEADHRRLTRDLDTLMASNTYKATSACAQAKSKSARSFCATVAETRAELARLTTILATATAADPEPQVTLLATLSGWQPAGIRFHLAVVPVLLAELLGAFGFVIASVGKAAPSPSPSGAPRRSLRARLAAWWRPSRKTPPEPLPEAAAAPSMADPRSAPPQSWTWPMMSASPNAKKPS